MPVALPQQNNAPAPDQIAPGYGISLSPAGAPPTARTPPRGRAVRRVPQATAAQRAASDPPPAAKTIRKATEASGQSGKCQSRTGDVRTCSQPGIISPALSREKIDSIEASSGSDRRSSRSIRRSRRRPCGTRFCASLMKALPLGPGRNERQVRRRSAAPLLPAHYHARPGTSAAHPPRVMPTPANRLLAIR